MLLKLYIYNVKWYAAKYTHKCKLSDIRHSFISLKMNSFSLSHMFSHTHCKDPTGSHWAPAFLGGWWGPKSCLIVDHSAICLPFHTNICQEIYHLQCSTIMWHDSKNVDVQSLSVFCRQESICRNEDTAVPSLLTTPLFSGNSFDPLQVSFFCQELLWFGLRTNAPFLSFF